MLSSDSFPLGPNGQFPRQRISSYGVSIVPPVSMQDTYLSGRNDVSKLPTLERDFHSSVLRVKGPMRHGVMMRGGKRTFHPRYVTLGQEEEDYYGMDTDVIFDIAGHRFDEGETDDSVGQAMTRANYFRGTVMPVMSRARMMEEKKRIPVMRGERWGSVMRAKAEKIGARTIQPATGVPSRSMQAVVGSGGWLKAIQGLLAGKVAPRPMPTGTAVMRGTAMKMSAGLFGDDSMGALPRRTSSGRTIARTWMYGRNKYYITLKGSDGKIERGMFIGNKTSPIDYV